VRNQRRARGIQVVINLAGGHIPELTARLHVETIREPAAVAADTGQTQYTTLWAGRVRDVTTS